MKKTGLMGLPVYGVVFMLVFAASACHFKGPWHTKNFGTQGDRAACQSIARAWPSLNRDLQQLIRIKTQDAYVSQRRLLQKRLAQQPQDACPVWHEPLARLEALALEFEGSRSSLHAADADGQTGSSQAPEEELGGLSQASLERRFESLHEAASEKALVSTNVSWRQWLADHNSTHPVAAEEVRQRYISNLGVDSALVQEDGVLGPPLDANHYVALVKTAVIAPLDNRLIALQGQGPLSAASADRYVAAALKFARSEGAERVVFVNTAGGQIPGFEAAATRSGIAMPDAPQYMEYDGWRDGFLVTPHMAAAFAKKVVDTLNAGGKRNVLVVNCNAGQDRSGIINALTQVIMQAEASFAEKKDAKKVAEAGFLSIDEAVSNMKAARPYAISTSARYIFIYRSFAAYLKMRQGV